MTHRAQFETRSADLTTEFGESMARKWFGDEAVDALPKFVRGKNAGKPKGMYVWTKVTRGGWVPNMHEPNGGHVENRVGTIVERQLCKRESSPAGVFVGEVISSLGAGQTHDERTAAREGNLLQTAIEELHEVRDQINEKMDTYNKLEGAVDGHEQETLIRGVMEGLKSEIQDLEAEEHKWSREVADKATPAAIDFATRCSDANIKSLTDGLEMRESDPAQRLLERARAHRAILDSVR